jgi:hypothetical protein
VTEPQAFTVERKREYPLCLPDSWTMLPVLSLLSKFEILKHQQGRPKINHAPIEGTFATEPAMQSPYLEIHSNPFKKSRSQRTLFLSYSLLALATGPCLRKDLLIKTKTARSTLPREARVTGHVNFLHHFRISHRR